MRPTLSALDSGTGVALWDPIENARFEVTTDRVVEPEPATPAAFTFPVDAAARVETESLSLAGSLPMTVYREGAAVESVDPLEETTIDGPCEVDVDSLPLKCYLRVDDAFSVSKSAAATRLTFDGPTTVTLGVRSFHDSPAGTVTTTPDPRGVMRAVSTFGSALKTTSPERSWPTLRGHPPLVEVGDSFEAPEGIDVPDTDIAIEVPETFDAVFQVTPLAFYLGAEVIPGDTPRLVADGTSHPLDEPSLFEGVRETLARMLLLDSVTRTEGLYDFPLAERQRLDEQVDADWSTLYDLPPGERVARYLELPADVVDRETPDWHLTTDVTPTASHASVLPYLADDLSLVRCSAGVGDAPVPSTPPEELTDFFRGDSGSSSGADPEPGSVVEGEVFAPDPVDTPGHAWVGEGYPLGGSKPTPSSLRRHLDPTDRDDPNIDVLVVVNDDRMADEAVGTLYGDREMLEFSVTVEGALSTDALRERLRERWDFFHYVGHVDDEGLRCPDGWLDCRTLTETGVQSFLLNACASYEQGHALVDAGSRGGVATVTDVHNAVATDAGQTLARLLNAGFSLHAALHITKAELVTSYRYTIVGDGELTLCQNRFGCPALDELEAIEDGYRLTYHTYPVRAAGLGTVVFPAIPGVEEAHLAGGTVGSWELTVEELTEPLSMDGFPVRLGNELFWSDQLDPSSL